MRVVRVHELLQQCLKECAEARVLVGLPPAAANAATPSASVRQFFLNNFTALAGWRS